MMSIVPAHTVSQDSIGQRSGLNAILHGDMVDPLQIIDGYRMEVAVAANKLVAHDAAAWELAAAELGNRIALVTLVELRHRMLTALMKDLENDLNG